MAEPGATTPTAYVSTDRNGLLRIRFTDLDDPQTVSYRLNRLRQLLGDDLDDPTARFELLLVLTGAPTAGG